MDKLQSEKDNPCKSLSGSIPKVFADNTSVVTARHFTNVRAKSVSITTENESNPGSTPSRTVAGHVPQADYTACGGSVICVDKYSDVTIEGAINISVTTKKTQGTSDAGAAEDTRPLPQGPAVKLITECKIKLIDCLRADLIILQYVDAKQIITKREYLELKNITQPEETVIRLIDTVINKGQEICDKFLQVLKEPEVLNTYPKLTEIMGGI